MLRVSALSICLLVGNPWFAAGQSTASPLACGIPLRPSSKSLLQDVERRFEKPVQCRIVTNLAQGEGGRASEELEADGTPLIKLDSTLGRSETEVVHELFHLQLRAQGFPQDFATTIPPGVDVKILRRAALNISGMLEHRLFYSSMRKMGLEPTKAYREELESHIAQDQPPPYANHPELLAVDYAVVVLVVNDPSLKQKVGAWYERHGWQDAMNRGKRLVSYVLQENPNTPDKKRVALAGCLETVFGDKFEIQ